MPTTADEMVAAARMNFGRARDDRAMELMRRWLNTGCRDWRRETDGVAADEVVVSAVFAKPIKAQLLRIQIANNVRRWGFLRREHATTNLRFLTIDEYMEGGTGDLVRSRVRTLLGGAVQKHEERMEFIDRIRKQRRAEKLAAFKEKQRKKDEPALRLVLKGFWLYASNERAKKHQAAGRMSYREDPNKKLRRLTRNVEFEVKDDYTDEGEPIWERIDRRYARR